MESIKKSCELNNNFTESLQFFYEAEEKYKDRKFTEALNLLENSLCGIEMPSSYILSKYYDFVASILWKIKEYDKSYYLWQKSLEYDDTNRHSQLSLSMLFDNTKLDVDVCELFIKIKLNEYYCSCGKKAFPCEEEKIIKYLLHFWENNLSSVNFDEMDELEIVDYFINVKVC
jgi:hypothetical protein